MTYREALAWLYSTQRFGIKLGLDNARRLFDELGVATSAPPVVHVAGTNGKGSVCAMVDAIARAAGHRSGLYTSPHLVTFRERIRVNGELIQEQVVADGLTRIRRLTDDWDPHPTFFEIATALALLSFAAHKLDLIILETGMGGRLDATNAMCSDVAVITSISFDHQKWLGDTLAKIAAEKAGIIKPRTPVLSSAQHPDAEAVIRQRALTCAAPVEFVTEPYTASGVRLVGEHQKLNAALAVKATRRLFDIDEETVARGLSSVDWPARFQRWDERTVIDGAHNPAGAAVLAQTWRETFGDRQATLIFAVLADKDIGAMCKSIGSIADFVFLPRMRSERATEPETLAQHFPIKSELCRDFAEALSKARTRSAPILVAGSLHFAGEALAFLTGRPAAFEECLQ